jgi:signal transduction histidine kinase
VTIPATICIVIAVVDALVALITARLSAGPGWRDLRAFSAAAALASIYASADVVFTAQLPAEVFATASRIGLCVAGLHGSAWFVYGAAQESRAPTRFERVMIATGAVVGALALIPGLFVGDVMYARPVPWLGVVYHDVYPTALGELCYAIYCFVLLSLVVRYARKWRRGSPGALVHAMGFGVLFAASINDSLSAARVYDGPYLATAGFFVLVMCVGVVLTSRFVESARSFEEQTARLRATQAELVERERLAALGELSALVAHEVRTPVSVMFNALSMLKRASPGAETLDLLSIVDEETHRLKRMIDDLLAFARPHSLQLGAVDLQPLIKDAVAAARDSLDSTCPVSVTVKGPLTIRCDEHLVREAVLNLVTNALQASDKADPVRVDACPDGARVRIAVMDEGVGVAPDVFPRLFTPFFTTRASGTGLGLAIVRRIAEAHGGEAFAEQRPGPGATFVLVLPVEAKAPDRPRSSA